MDAPASPFPHLNLLFALLRRWLALWIAAKPPTRFVRMLAHTEHTLANAIRATLTADGVAFPTLDDPAFLVWFKTTCPGSDHITRARPCTNRSADRTYGARRNARAAPSHRDGAETPRRLHASVPNASGIPATHDARAPP
jgi:hypothetical protein